MRDKDAGSTRVSPMNRTMKNYDSFLRVFPTYGVLNDKFKSTAKGTWIKTEKNDDGTRTYAPDRTFFAKMDYTKAYTEEMLKLSNMMKKKNK